MEIVETLIRIEEIDNELKVLARLFIVGAICRDCYAEHTILLRNEKTRLQNDITMYEHHFNCRLV